MEKKKTKIDTDKIGRGLIIAGGIVGTAVGLHLGVNSVVDPESTSIASVLASTYLGASGGVFGGALGAYIGYKASNGVEKICTKVKKLNKFLPQNYKGNKKETSQEI